MTDLVVMSLEAWDGVWRRNQHLVWRLLQSDPSLRVLYVEPAADPLHDVRSRRRPQRRRGPDDRVLPGRLWTMRPLKALPRSVDPRADERISDQVVRAARRLGFTAPLVWINDPGAAAVARRSGWPALYDITDDWLAADRPADQLDRVRREEEWLLEHAAEVVACSPELVRRKSPLRAAGEPPIRLVPNAVDVAAYRRTRPRPADLPAGRTAVYVGTLHPDRLDVTLCAETAAALTGAGTLVLVGPDALPAADRTRLRAAGVVLLGSKTRDEVVAYLQHADVLVVPHVVTPFTESLDPIKLYEYLAAGRPVVSAPVAGFRDSSAPRVLVAPRGDFARAVATALDGAQDAAASETDVPDWSDRASAVRQILAGMRA